MKPSSILILLIAAFTAPHLYSQETANNTSLGPVGFLPGSKVTTSVDPNERNPYSIREKKLEVKEDDGNSEAARIRDILQSLRVRGTSVGPRGRRVLFGDLMLMEGHELPRLLPGQTDRLMTTRVTEKEVEIAWLSESGREIADGRKLLIQIDIAEVIVTIILPGQGHLKPEERKTDQQRLGPKDADIRPIEVAAPANQP